MVQVTESSADACMGVGSNGIIDLRRGSSGGTPLDGAQSIVDVVRRRAEIAPDATALVFLEDGETAIQSWNYGRLWREVACIASGLRAAGADQERVVLLVAPGLAYVAAFLGTLAAGATAVPLHPPVGRGPTARVAGVLGHCEPRLIVTSADFVRKIPESNASDAPTVLTLDEVRSSGEGGPPGPPPASDRLAMLQYTSGSTGDPRGVMLSHGNLMANCHNIYAWLGPDPDRKGCIWLPPYHDMGLLGGILQPLFAGYPLVFFSPLDFVQQPIRWLRAISEFGLTLSGAPNFAYDACVDSISDQELASLDLSSWRQAFCGAEIVHEKTMARFSQRFAAAGFSARAFTPCYGLAEATLLVSGKPRDVDASVRTLCREQLDDRKAVDAAGEKARVVVGCGTAPPGVEVRIVDPDTGVECLGSDIGEIWVAGPAVAHGYWRRPEATDATFGGTLEGCATRFLRTGDLGFVTGSELFVSGRIKDLVIVAGRNHHAEDLEATAEAAHPLLGLGCAAAFSLNDESTERLVLVVEVKISRASTEDEYSKIARAISSAVTSVHRVTPWNTILCRRGVIPRTTSGKVRRSETRAKFEAGALPAVYGTFV